MELEPITSLDLMERAAGNCAERLIFMLRNGELTDARRGLVVAGMGNNGGDGLVMARVLAQAGFRCGWSGCSTGYREAMSMRRTCERWREQGGEVRELDGSIEGFQVSEDEFVVDALFGSGLTHPPKGWLRSLVEFINGSNRPVVSIDLPSGMMEPGGEFDPNACIRAQHTFTFEAPRLSLLLPETGPYAGNWELVPIGLDPEFLAEAPREGNWVTKERLRYLLHPVPRFSHKGSRGHAFVLAGSAGMFGAAVLAVQGALRSGAGLITAHVPADLAVALAISVPDALSSVDPAADHLSALPELDRCDSLATRARDRKEYGYEGAGEAMSGGSEGPNGLGC